MQRPGLSGVRIFFGEWVFGGQEGYYNALESQHVGMGFHLHLQVAFGDLDMFLLF